MTSPRTDARRFRTTAMGTRRLIELPARPAGEPSLLVGTTLLAACLGGLFSLAVLAGILLAYPEPPAAQASNDPAALYPTRDDVEAVVTGNGAGR